MNVVSSLCTNEVGYAADKMIQKSAIVITDGRRCYIGLQSICNKHEAILVKDKKASIKSISLGRYGYKQCKKNGSLVFIGD